MANQMNSNLPDDDSVLKSIADLMVEKVFEAKVIFINLFSNEKIQILIIHYFLQYHDIEKNFIRENEVDSSPVDGKHGKSFI